MTNDAKIEKTSARLRRDDAITFCEGAQSLTVRGLRGGVAYEVQDWVADEVPVALEYNGISHAVMLATPLDLEDFALGFSLSEGIVDRPDEIYAIEEEPMGEAGITLHLRVASSAFARLKERRRGMTGRTGCGLCGTESLQHVMRPLPPVAPAPVTAAATVSRAMCQLKSLQTLQQATGAVHAAAWCTADGELRWLREDVGRHNALDKLIGALAHHDVDASRGFFVVTSRASFEMVQKTAAAGVALLVAVSAPTSLAVATADRLGLTLVGFARQHDLAVYSHADRLALNPSALASAQASAKAQARHAH